MKYSVNVIVRAVECVRVATMILGLLLYDPCAASVVLLFFKERSRRAKLRSGAESQRLYDSVFFGGEILPSRLVQTIGILLTRVVLYMYTIRQLATLLVGPCPLLLLAIPLQRGRPLFAVFFLDHPKWASFA